MPNPTPVMPPISPQPSRRSARAYDIIFGAVVIAFVLSCFAALLAVGTLMATARPVMRWRVTRPPAIVVTPTDPSGWQTYRNEELGFTFQYPVGWQFQLGGGENYAPSVVTINDSTQVTGGISVYYYASVADETENKDNHLGAKTLPALIENNQLIQKLGDITVGGVKAVEVIRGGNGAYYGVFIERNGHLYEIVFADASSKKDLTGTDHQILSTFKFIEPIDTTDWQTYEDKLYYFSDDDFYLYGFKYPGDGVRRQADKRIDFPVSAVTNLREKYIVVKAGLGANPRYQPQYCLAPAAVMIKSEYISINDVDFIRQEWQEGAAGSQLEQISYLLDTGHEGEFCIGVNFVFRSSNPEVSGNNLPPVFDHEAEQQVVEDIMETFYYDFVSKAN